MCLERSKELILKNQGQQGDFCRVYVPVQFDMSWNSCGWSVNRAIISTLAENTALVLAVSYVVFVQNIWKIYIESLY